MDGIKNGAAFIIDRFEDGFAVCERTEGTGYINIPRELIDADAGEGAVVAYDEKSGRLRYDAGATEARAEQMRALASKLWK